MCGRITREGIFHLPKSNYSYGYDSETLHLRIRTKKGEVKKAYLRIGDPYIWEVGGADGGNLGAGGTGWKVETLPMKKEVETEYFDYWIGEYKPEKKRSRYAFILEGKEEKILFTEKKIYELGKNDDIYILSKVSDFFCFPYLNNIDVPKSPEWAKDMIWYQIFPDRFNNGDPSINPEGVEPWGTEPTGKNFMGGDLRGIIEKLDYLEDLGITGLYLCPIFKATSNHRYETIDYFQIDPALGDKETFKELVDELHKRNMKILLDGVFNHMGYFSPQWQDVIKNGEKSKFKDWFHINKFPAVDRPLEKLDGRNLNYETFGRTPKMPKLNTENPDVVEYLLKVGEYWSGEMNIDGWRLDVSNEIDHVFWRKFKERILAVNPNSYIVGEIWHDSLPWLMGDQFNGVMNYPLGDGIKDFFCYDCANGEEFKYMINKVNVSYPKQVNEVMFNLLDSHDTPRILTLAKGSKEKVKLALLFMFTQAGSPCIYYGTEIGMEGNQGNGQEFHRRCMAWDKEKQDKDMLDFTKKLINMRKVNPQLKALENKWVIAGKNTPVLIYKKEDITVIINNSKEEIVIPFMDELKNRKAFDVFNEENIDLKESIKLKGYEFKVLL